MIARQLVLPHPVIAPRVSGTRSGRAAAERRRHRTRRLRYAVTTRTLAVVAALTVCFFVYLALMANVTRMNYEIAANNRLRAQLQNESTRLGDRIAALESRDRLAAVAARLGMREPAVFAEVSVPATRPTVVAKHGLALLSAVVPWLR